MWILPRQLHTSPYVPDTEALISDLNEQSQACAQSLLVRSKPSPARTWSLKWKRDSWTQLLSGRILKPSHGQSFAAAWTSSVADIRASHSARPASDSAPKTPDTSGLTYQPELLQCDQVSVSLKTSRDISRWGCPTSSKTWADWVTERRGAWRQRVNAARLTSGSGSLSWPTIRASEYKDVGPVGSKSHDHMLGKHYLCAVVTQEEVNWPTAQSRDYRSVTGNEVHQRDNAMQNLNVAVVMHGPAAPASSNTSGSRQGLWATPGTTQAAMNGQGAPTLQALMENGIATNIRNRKWKDGQVDVAPRGNGVALASQAMAAQWATPKTPTGGPETAKRKQELGRTASGGGDLASQANGKLNPRWVETLMGLPIGWTMPSCTSPQTIAPTSCDSSAMELCQPPQSGLFECCSESLDEGQTPIVC
jgi:hypothetical protein